LNRAFKNSVSICQKDHRSAIRDPIVGTMANPVPELEGISGGREHERLLHFIQLALMSSFQYSVPYELLEKKSLMICIILKLLLRKNC
jgi:hypothetical protein